MRSPIRTLLLWLLALALPAQGVSAATMALCGPNHHGAGPAAHSASADAQHDHHGGHHAGAAQVDEVSSSVQLAEASDNLNKADSHKCSVCASCCSAAAILNSLPELVAAQTGTTVFATVDPSVEPFAADGPDRPPRVFLA